LFSLFAGIIIGTQIFINPTAEGNGLPFGENIKPVFPVNENGQTYGSSMNSKSLDDFPDLIEAVSKDGAEGYVYYTDLYGDMPNSPEQAAKYMEDMRELNERGIFVKAVPVYKLDGKTVIGKYEISFDSRLFQTESDRKNSKEIDIWSKD